MNTPRANDDPLSLRYELGAVLAGYEVTPSPAKAFAVAAALGKTRLFGVAPGRDLDGRLPPAIANAAVEGIEAALPEWLRAVRKLDAGYEDRWRTEGDEDCIALLEARVNVWGALVAIQEAADARPELAPVAPRAHAAAKTFDLWLRAQEPELSAVAGLPLLANWKALLAPPYRDPLPWWLDGTLDAAATQRRDAALAAVPSAAVSRLVANRALLLDMPARVAAEGNGPPLLFPSGSLSWVSPDGRWTARLMVPAICTPAEKARPRPINFESADGECSAVFPAETPVRIGAAEGETDSHGQFRVRIDQLPDTDRPHLNVAGERWAQTNKPQPRTEEKRT